MRHLHFTQALDPLKGGGMGLSTVALHQQFLAMGIESTLCSTYGEAPRRPAERVVEFRRVKPDFLYFAPEMCAQARELVAGADIVHGHGLYVGTNLLLGRQARRQRKKLVYHVHGFFEPYILQRARWKKRLVHLLFENANFRQVRLWRALTDCEAGQIRACGIQAPIVVAPIGLDPGAYAAPPGPVAAIETPLIPRLSKNGRRILFLGRIHPKKGLDLLLSAWARLGAEGRDWELVVAGPDEGGYLKVMQRLAHELHIEGRVLFTGPVTPLDKNKLLHSADLFVLPSYSEGFPTSLLEAMACQVPIVATRGCHFPEVAIAGAGWECEAAQDSLLATLAGALAASESERAERGRRGRQLVETRYSWSRTVSILVEACRAHC